MAKREGFHEDLSRSGSVKAASNRLFGIVFAVFFTVIGLWPLMESGDVRTWSLGLAIALLLMAVIVPRALTPLNFLWTGFAKLMHRITSPVIMAFLFYIVVTPMGIAMRLAGKDPMRRERDEAADSYWIERQPPGPEPETLKKQF